MSRAAASAHLGEASVGLATPNALATELGGAIRGPGFRLTSRARHRSVLLSAYPPHFRCGAGKTRLVVHLAEQLNRRAALTVAIATQTRAQVLDVTNRAAAIGTKVALLGTRDSHRPTDLHSQAGYLKGAADLGRWQGVVVATTARWLWVSERDYTAEVCIVSQQASIRMPLRVGRELQEHVKVGTKGSLLH